MTWVGKFLDLSLPLLQATTSSPNFPGPHFTTDKLSGILVTPTTQLTLFRLGINIMMLLPLLAYLGGWEGGRCVSKGDGRRCGGWVGYGLGKGVSVLGTPVCLIVLFPAELSSVCFSPSVFSFAYFSFFLFPLAITSFPVSLVSLLRVCVCFPSLVRFVFLFPWLFSLFLVFSCFLPLSLLFFCLFSSFTSLSSSCSSSPSSFFLVSCSSSSSSSCSFSISSCSYNYSHSCTW